MQKQAKLFSTCRNLGTSLANPPQALSIRCASSFSRPKSSELPHNVSQDDFLKIKRMAMNLVDCAAKEPTGWNHTRSLRGQEKRLLASLQNASSTRGPSMEKAKYTADVAGADEDSVGIGLLPLGTFVETRRQFNRSPLLSAFRC